MPGSILHNKIAGLAGIPDRISNEINRFMDDVDPPPEFEEHNSERKIFVCGHLNVSIRHLTGSESSLNKLRERGKLECVQKEDLKWMLATRKEYIKCYYLHLAVDNIYETMERIKRVTIVDCINRWEKEHSIIIPGTQAYLKDVLGFLRNNTENIKQILFPEEKDGKY